VCGIIYLEIMTTMLDVKSLSKVEKLRLLETLWVDLSRDEASVTSPAWHETALNEANRLQAEGKASFSDWSEAKARLRESVS
jgi:hypothetical protein